MKDTKELVQQFAEHVILQKEAIRVGDTRAGNRHADAYIRAWEELRALGHPGREA